MVINYWKISTENRRLSWWGGGVTIGWMWWVLWTILRIGGTKVDCIHRGHYLRGLNGGGQGLPVLAWININHLIPSTAGLGAQGVPKFYVRKWTAYMRGGGPSLLGRCGLWTLNRRPALAIFQHPRLMRPEASCHICLQTLALPVNKHKRVSRIIFNFQLQK